MKILLTTLNAKFIHTSLALRWLYVANKERHHLSFSEYTIKESALHIVEELLQSGCDVIGFSVYIWNVARIGEIIAMLKARKPGLIVLVGGPEVTYEPEFFLREWNINYVISGEGEFVLGELLDAIKSDASVENICGVSSRAHINTSVAQADPARLATLPSPYMLQEDREHLPNRLVYVEASRGCPYQCQYCLSSREKGVRYFPMEFVRENLSYLIDSGVRQIKFLDRTFNLNMAHTRGVFEFLIAHHREGLSCQFEIYADLLKDEMIDYLNQHLPPRYFRFEIGIQSTHEPTNAAVKRKQNFPLLADNIRKLMAGGKIDLHLDLIAGLPYETFTRFVRSFNEVFALGAKEVQLGFLKMLRGTNMRSLAQLYGYVYDAQAPYEIFYNADITSEEFHRIHHAEHALERFWNSGRFKRTMHELFNSYYKGRYFEFFDELAGYAHAQAFPERGYQLELLYALLHGFLQSKGIELFALLRDDYYDNFTLRPPGFWAETMEKKEKKKLLYLIGQDKTFLNKHGLTRKMVEKLAAIDPLDEEHYLLTFFIYENRQTKRLPVVYKFSAH